MQTLNKLAQALSTQTTSSRQLVEQCLAHIDDGDGEGQRAFLTLYRERALTQADEIDAARKKGWALSQFSGIPISIKDLFDCRGEITRAGSHVLDEQPAALADAEIVTALRQAGFIIIGKTNMTEFAYSGLGINAHFGTPKSPFDRATGRIPGGSSCGGAVSVSDTMAVATIGTDTGGSCRIPAAFCGIVGFKPTAERVSRQGVVPLSSSLDSIGPLANSVSCCCLLDNIISGARYHSEDTILPARPPQGLRLGVIEGYTTDAMDDSVAADFAATLSRISAAGVQVTSLTLPELDALPDINSKGGLVGAEAFAWHQSLLQTRRAHYDPWVRARLEYASAQSAADYLKLLNHRQRIQSLVRKHTRHFDVLALPTVQIIPPAIDSLTDVTHSSALNQLCLRNTAIGNFLNHPSISIPSQAPGTAPTGFMLMANDTLLDAQLFSIAAGLEPVIRQTSNAG